MTLWRFTNVPMEATMKRLLVLAATGLMLLGSVQQSGATGIGRLYGTVSELGG